METKNKEEKPKEPKMAVPVSSVKPVETPTPEVQLIITSQPESSQAPKRINKGKRVSIDDVETQVKIVHESRVVWEDPDEPVKVLIKKAVEQARLLAITKPEVVKVGLNSSVESLQATALSQENHLAK
nr:hypothetical protein [Tanacetum cinerariifolium]